MKKNQTEEQVAYPFAIRKDPDGKPVAVQLLDLPKVALWNEHVVEIDLPDAKACQLLAETFRAVADVLVSR